eukprot:2861726-Pleurochrysis_carterae.AAC.2
MQNNAGRMLYSGRLVSSVPQKEGAKDARPHPETQCVPSRGSTLARQRNSPKARIVKRSVCTAYHLRRMRRLKSCTGRANNGVDSLATSRRISNIISKMMMISSRCEFLRVMSTCSSAR